MRRGIIKASITRLDGCVAELEAKHKLTAEDRLSAQHLLQKLNSLEVDFKSFHLALVDGRNEEVQEAEQLILDKTDDKVGYYNVRLQCLVSGSLTSMMSISSVASDPGCNLFRRLNYVVKKLWAILCEVESIPSKGEIDTCLLLQHEEQLSSSNMELTNVLHELLSLEEVDSSLLEQQS